MVEGVTIQVVFVLKAWLAHHESVSRCFDDNPDKQECWNRDSTVTMKRWEYPSRPTRPMVLTSDSTVGTSPWPCDHGRKSRGTTETCPTIPLLLHAGPVELTRKQARMFRNAVLMIAFLTVLAGCGSTADPTGAPNTTAAPTSSETDGEPSGRLAVSTRQVETDDWEIGILDFGEGTVQMLTENQAFDWGPTWSPDGTRIAFASEFDAGIMEEMMIPDEDNPGQMKAHIQEKTRDREIVVVGFDGSAPKLLSVDPYVDDSPAWSPNGTQIAFTSDRTMDVEIFVMDADGGNVQQLTNNPGEDWQPDWSPDGQRIVFAGSVSGDFEISVMDADGGNVEQLTASPGHDWGPVWSPDGRRIAFASNRSGNFDVYVMDADGGNVEQLTDDPAEDFEPVWSPDGRHLAFGSRRLAGEMRIYLMATDGSDVQPTGVSGIPSDWFSTS